MRTYYHGQYAWPNYVLDVVGATELNARLQHSNIKLAKAAQEQREEILRQGEAQEETLTAIRDHVQGIADEIQLGVSLIADRLDEQLQLFSQAVTKLEEIHRTLRIPRQTEANELFLQGESWFRRGLFEESLDAYLKAEEIYKVHYLLQFRIGALFLEGRNTRSNVINLPPAESHLLLATRYAEVQDTTDISAQRICSEAYFRAGKAAYLLAEEHRKEADSAGVRACLRRALEHLNNSAHAWSPGTATFYWQAKCHALLGEKLATLGKFVELSDRNRKYCAIACEDGDFETLRDDIRKIFVDALHSPGPRACKAQAELQRALECLSWAERSQPESSVASRVKAIERELRQAAQGLPTLNANIDLLLYELPRLCVELDEITLNTTTAKIATLQQQISHLKSQRTSYEDEIQSCRQKMKQNDGSGAVGCLGSIIFLFLLAFVVTILRPVLQGVMPTPPGGNVLFVNVMLLTTAIAGYITGVKLSKHYKKRAIRAQLNTSLARVDDWQRATPSVIQLREAALSELADQLAQFERSHNANAH